MSEPLSLVDSHCHLAEPDFDADRDAVLQRAVAAGVTGLVCVGATGAVESNFPAVALAGRPAPVSIVATVGIHPHDASTADDAAFETLARLATTPGVVAVGETGLDFHYDRSHAEAAAILRAEGAAAVGGVIHCFTGERDDVGPYLDLGFSISVAGIVTFKNADVLRDAVRAVPLDRLLVETDAPYLAPVPHRGRRNEPAHVRLVAEMVATVRGEPFAVVAGATAANARRLFSLPAG